MSFFRGHIGVSLALIGSGDILIFCLSRTNGDVCVSVCLFGFCVYVLRLFCSTVIIGCAVRFRSSITVDNTDLLVIAHYLILYYGRCNDNYLYFVPGLEREY